VYGHIYAKLRGEWYVPRADPADVAEEATQFAFLQAARYVDTPDFFESFVHFVNWSKTVARNWTLEKVVRPSLTRPTVPLPPGGLAERERPDDVLRSAVWDCIQRLPEPHRTVMLLRCYENLTDEEIGLKLWPDDAGSPSAKGQRARRVRIKAEALMRLCLQSKGWGQ
jgi:DNA-directed RNA polymerase specialized sigma24 family protein